jgi:BirA family biotin operon repressor/biotin-[acetyl-CoA-carboxylase] ligase
VSANAAEIECWRLRLNHACAALRSIKRVVVLDETPSTQDAPETRAAEAGTLVTAWRQTAGRGRFGRQWADTGTEGVAASFVVEAQSSERLALIGAVAAAEACASLLESGIASGLASGSGEVGIKWPNDTVVAGRKLAGVLIERRGDLAVVGIGINVAQRAFEGELAARATSLAILGTTPDRMDVLLELMRAIDTALDASDAHLVARFARRDALRGTRALFATPEGPVEGEVVSLEPMRGLVVRTDSGERFLPALTTSVAEWGVFRRGSPESPLKTADSERR